MGITKCVPRTRRTTYKRRSNNRLAGGPGMTPPKSRHTYYHPTRRSVIIDNVSATLLPSVALSLPKPLINGHDG